MTNNNKQKSQPLSITDYEDKYKHLRARKPVSFHKQSAMAGIDKEPGFHYYGFDETDKRIEEAVLAGYEFVRDTQNRTLVPPGHPQQQGTILRTRVNQGDYRNITSHQIIMRKPLDLYKQHTEDRLLENARLRKKEFQADLKKNGLKGEFSQSQEYDV